MNELLNGFVLGNTAILTNACLLPLYPGFLAFLAGNANPNSAHPRPATGWLGVLVLLGILSMMMLVGLVLFVLQQSFGNALTLLLPIVYALVIVLGVLLILGRNPFAQMAVSQAKVLRNPYLTAYLYGVMFGPMTLPCTGPIILSAFALGANSTTELVNGLLYFLTFGLGFGWPLVALAFIAQPVQRRLIRLLTQNHLLLNRASGILLVAIGIFGILTELVPVYFAIEVLSMEMWFVYWAVVALIAAGVTVISLRQRQRQQENVG